MSCINIECDVMTLAKVLREFPIVLKKNGVLNTHTTFSGFVKLNIFTVVRFLNIRL